MHAMCCEQQERLRQEMLTCAVSTFCQQELGLQSTTMPLNPLPIDVTRKTMVATGLIPAFSSTYEW